MNNFFLFLICIAIPMSVGAISGIFTIKAVNGWYAKAIKPSFNPPNYVFGPVWTALYLMMGVSLYLILKQADAAFPTSAVIVFSIQLILNFFWSLIFFKWQKLGLALFEIIAMWLAIVAMIFVFYCIKPVAAFLQIPYLCWVSFATVLNAAFWRLNK